jgi:NADPH-dependent curcumin reductase CurA
MLGGRRENSANTSQIDTYNKPKEEHHAIKNILYVLTKRITMQGFMVGDPGFGDKYNEEHQQRVSEWLAEGTVKMPMTVTEGIDNAGQGFIEMLTGKGFGKAVLNIKPASK